MIEIHFLELYMYWVEEEPHTPSLSSCHRPSVCYSRDNTTTTTSWLRSAKHFLPIVAGCVWVGFRLCSGIKILENHREIRNNRQSRILSIRRISLALLKSCCCYLSWVGKKQMDLPRVIVAIVVRLVLGWRVFELLSLSLGPSNSRLK